MKKNIVFFLVGFLFIVFVPFFVCTAQIQNSDEKTFVVNKVAEVLDENSQDEAIKAQIVIEYTNALKENADFSRQINPECSKSFLERISNLYDEVESKVITYNGQPIVAAYHTLSNGNTNDAEAVWGERVDYLVSVKSEGDLVSPNREYSSAFTKEQLSGKLKTDTENDEISVEYTTSGYVKTVSVMGKTLSGEEFRKLFSLKSSAFTIELVSGNYVINGVGDGHGVGLSLNGADFLARQGYTYKDILTHYYQGCEITSMTKTLTNEL